MFNECLEIGWKTVSSGDETLRLMFDILHETY